MFAHGVEVLLSRCREARFCKFGFLVGTVCASAQLAFHVQARKQGGGTREVPCNIGSRFGGMAVQRTSGNLTVWGGWVIMVRV